MGRKFLKGRALDGLTVFIVAHAASPHRFGLPDQDKPLPFATKAQSHEEIPEWFCDFIKPSLCLSDFVADNKKIRAGRKPSSVLPVSRE